ncbi:DUF4349 domain-containing protein [Streptomyces sp. NPDC094049]|uniref:DUF4349 domain-containing protein n=1 Tax=Streptomyces sp. NPDC094049 TaxID=3154987 RepID=UPI003329F710
MTSVRTTARTRTAAGAVLLTAALALTGCAGGAGGDSAKDKGDLSAAQSYEEGWAASGGDARKGSPEASADAAKDKAKAKVPAQQHVIRTASLEVEVADAAKSLATARRVASGAGGHVENETTERIDDEHMMSTVVLRVPQERYDSVLGELAGAGKLLARKSDAKDVTGQVVDVESRIATQRASVARVRTLMDRAERLADVVTLEGELSRRQADLESLLAQQASLKDRTSLATITLTLLEKPKEGAAEEPGRPGLGDALSGGWNALAGAVAWIGIVLAALAPWLAVALVAYLLWRRLVSPRLAARRPAQGTPSPVPPTVPRNAAGAPAAPGPLETPGTPGE